MNILHITNSSIPNDSRIIKQINSLASKSNFKILGIGIKLKSERSINSLKYKNLDLKSVALYSAYFKFLPRQIKHVLNFTQLLIRILIETRGLKVDIVHCHDTLVLPIGVLIKKFKKAKLIYDAHELESNKNGQTKLMSLGTLIIEKKSWKYIDLLISVSNSILKWYSKNIGPKKNILVLNSPLISTRFDSNNEKEKLGNNYFNNVFGIPDGCLIFIYVGYLTKGRGINQIIDIFNDRDINSHLIFLGDGPLKDFIVKESKINYKIHYHEPVKHDRVVEIIKSADVGLCLIENISLSDFYCLPNKLFEYAFSDLPVLSSDFPELKKIINKYKLGIVCKNEFKSIQRVIKKIEKSPLKKTNTDISKLSWEFQERILLESYENLYQNKNK